MKAGGTFETRLPAIDATVLKTQVPLPFLPVRLLSSLAPVSAGIVLTVRLIEAAAKLFHGDR